MPTVTGRHSTGNYLHCGACGHAENLHHFRHPFALPHPWNLRPGGKHRATKPGSAAGDYTPRGLQRLARGA